MKVDGQLLYGTTQEITRRRKRYVALPAAVMAPMASSLGVIQRPLAKRSHYPADREGVEFIARDTRRDDTAARKEFRVTPRPLDQTFGETISWLVDSGRLTPRHVRCAAGPKNSASRIIDPVKESNAPAHASR
jgi:hypothetical protein